MFNIKQLITRFQQTNEKAFYLAFLRVSVSCWFLKELLFRSPAFELLYSNHSFLKIAPSSSLYLFHIDPAELKEHYLLLIGLCVALLLLNIFGIGRNLVSILLFLSLTLLNCINDRLNNSGDEMALLLLFYLSLANTFAHFTLFKRMPFSASKEKLYNLLSNLAACSIIINLCLAYFMPGAFKLLDPYWKNGTALHYFLNDDRYSVFAAGGKQVGMPAAIMYVLNYSIILLELSFPVLVWFKKSRPVVLFLFFLMHLGIYFFLMIYAMSVIFVIQYGMFYTNEEMLALWGKIRNKCRKVFGLARQ